MPATDWQRVRKDVAGETDVSKAVTSAAVAESGKAPPGQISGRVFPGERVKVPPVDDTADKTEIISLPRKCGCSRVKETEKCGCSATVKEGEEAKCACSTEVAKCACGQSLKERAAAMFGMEVGPDGELKDKAEAAPTETPAPEAPPAEVEKAIEPYKQPSKPGVMIALAVPDHVAKKLQQEGGMAPEDMHVTLGYYGKLGEHVDEQTLDAMRKCVMKQVQSYKPFKAAIGGLGRFNATKSSDEKDVLIGLVDSPDLHDMREALIQAVAKCNELTTKDGDGATAAPAGPQVFKNHGYTPHITLGYIDPTDQLSVHKLEREEFTFTHVLMQVGKDKALYALGEQPNVSKSIWMPIVKADDDQRLATGIVLQPEVVDAQGDIISAQVIRQAAHNFLALYNKKTQLGLQHELMKPDGVELVESWIAPVDMLLNNRMIKAGTWMMTVRVKNDVLWTKIKTGQLGGFSIGGVAKVQKLAV